MDGVAIRSCWLVACCTALVHAASLNLNVDRFNHKASSGWHIHITMNVYSGRQDPVWLIPENHPAYKPIIGSLDTSQGRPLPTNLGYKGFSLVHIPPGSSYMTGGHQNWTVTSFPDMEMFLLHTTDDLHDDLVQHVRDSIVQPLSSPRKRRSLYDGLGDYGSYDFGKYGSLFGKPTTVDPLMELSNADMYALAKLWGLDKRFRNITTTPQPAGPTKFEPQKWNTYFVEQHNNCYNYANDKITDTFAQPGRAGNCDMPTETLSHGYVIEKLSKCDGLKPVPALSTDHLPSHDWNLVALVFWPPKPGSDVYDFHWYRLDRDGKWSHKPGKTEATNLDSSSRLISDPRQADRGPYTEFVGFMQTLQDKIIIL
ncbi:hypothetical protein ACF0H5_001899 [Mactra antiquata]